MSELKPCPFCDGEADIGGDDNHEYTVAYCTKCGISTDGYLTSECGVDFALEAWNARHNKQLESKDEAEVKALRETLRLKELECQQLAQDKAELVSCCDSLEKHKTELRDAVDYLHGKLIGEGKRYGASINRKMISGLLDATK